MAKPCRSSPRRRRHERNARSGAGAVCVRALCFLLMSDALAHVSTLKSRRKKTSSKKQTDEKRLSVFWSRRRDLNPRPLGPEPSALPNCATPRLRCILYQRRRGFASDFAEHLKMWRAFVCSLLQRWYKKASLLHNPPRCVTMFYGGTGGGWRRFACGLFGLAFDAGAPVNTVRCLSERFGRAEGRKQPCSGIIFCSSCSPRSL